MSEIKYITPRYENLTRIAKEIGAKTFLEIGTWAGITAQNLILTAKEYANSDEVLYVGIDLFELLTPELKKLEHSKEAKLRSSVLNKIGGLDVPVFLHKGFSNDVLPTLPDQKFDMIYIDGGHRDETIAQDWNDVQRFISDKTVVVFDDYRRSDPGVGCKKLVDGLNRDTWGVEILEPTEKFAFGLINLAKVVRR